MTFLNPILLGWLAAIGVPILVHLLTRQARRKLDLPTLRFVQKSISEQSRLFKWRHLIVLLLRTLIVVCIVLAFARPVVTGPLGIVGGGKKCMIIVIDDSASMGYRSGGVSTWDHARQDALNLLSTLHTGDRANVIVCDAHPHALLTQPGIDIGTLRDGLQALEPTSEKGDPSSAISIAADQLGQSSGEPQTRAVYILSDFLRSAWGNVRFDALPADVKLAFQPSTDDTRSNVGITSLHLYPAVPRVGDPITVDCGVFNSSNDIRTVPVTLTLTGGYKTTQNVTLSPYSSADATFALGFDSPETVECTVNIPSDNLPVDDVRRAVIDLQQSATVLLVTDEALSDPKSAAYYLSRALHPNQSSSAGFHVIVVAPDQLNQSLLNTADAVIVCDAAMDDSEFQQIAQYDINGGNLIWMICGINPGAALTHFGSQLPTTSPLPFSIRNIADLTGNGIGYVTLSEADYSSPLLKAFKDPAAADLSSIHFKRIAITSEVDPRAEVLLKFDDGTAAAVKSDIGSGNLLLLNMSSAPAWSDLARQDAFLPLMHEFLKGLLQRPTSARESYAGGSASTSIVTQPGQSKSVSLSCYGPNGEVQMSADPSTGSVLVYQTDSPGFYRVLSNDQKQVGDIAVNVNPDESDLRQIDPKELETNGQQQRSYVAASAGDSASSLVQDTQLWPFLLVLSLILLIVEQWVAGLRTRRSSKVFGL